MESNLDLVTLPRIDVLELVLWAQQHPGFEKLEGGERLLYALGLNKASCQSEVKP